MQIDFVMYRSRIRPSLLIRGGGGGDGGGNDGMLHDSPKSRKVSTLIEKTKTLLHVTSCVAVDNANGHLMHICIEVLIIILTIRSTTQSRYKKKRRGTTQRGG